MVSMSFGWLTDNWLLRGLLTSLFSGFGFLFITLTLDYAKKYCRKKKHQDKVVLLHELLKGQGLLDWEDDTHVVPPGRMLGTGSALNRRPNLFHAYKQYGCFLGMGTGYYADPVDVRDSKSSICDEPASTAPRWSNLQLSQSELPNFMASDSSRSQYTRYAKSNIKLWSQPSVAIPQPSEAKKDEVYMRMIKEYPFIAPFLKKTDYPREAIPKMTVKGDEKYPTPRVSKANNASQSELFRTPSKKTSLKSVKEASRTSLKGRPNSRGHSPHNTGLKNISDNKTVLKEDKSSPVDAQSVQNNPAQKTGAKVKSFSRCKSTDNIRSFSRSKTRSLSSLKNSALCKKTEQKSEQRREIATEITASFIEIFGSSVDSKPRGDGVASTTSLPNSPKRRTGAKIKTEDELWRTLKQSFEEAERKSKIPTSNNRQKKMKVSEMNTQLKKFRKFQIKKAINAKLVPTESKNQEVTNHSPRSKRTACSRKSKDIDHASHSEDTEHAPRLKYTDHSPKSNPVDHTSQSKGSDNSQRSKDIDHTPKSKYTDLSSKSKDSNHTSRTKSNDDAPKSAYNDHSPKSNDTDHSSRSNESDHTPQLKASKLRSERTENEYLDLKSPDKTPRGTPIKELTSQHTNLTSTTRSSEWTSQEQRVTSPAIFSGRTSPQQSFASPPRSSGRTSQQQHVTSPPRSLNWPSQQHPPHVTSPTKSPGKTSQRSHSPTAPSFETLTKTRDKQYLCQALQRSPSDFTSAEGTIDPASDEENPVVTSPKFVTKKESIYVEYTFDSLSPRDPRREKKRAITTSLEKDREDTKMMKTREELTIAKTPKTSHSTRDTARKKQFLWSQQREISVERNPPEPNVSLKRSSFTKKSKRKPSASKSPDRPKQIEDNPKSKALTKGADEKQDKEILPSDRLKAKRFIEQSVSRKIVWSKKGRDSNNTGEIEKEGPRSVALAHELKNHKDAKGMFYKEISKQLKSELRPKSDATRSKPNQDLKRGVKSELKEKVHTQAGPFPDDHKSRKETREKTVKKVPKQPSTERKPKKDAGKLKSNPESVSNSLVNVRDKTFSQLKNVIYKQPAKDRNSPERNPKLPPSTHIKDKVQTPDTYITKKTDVKLKKRVFDTNTSLFDEPTLNRVPSIQNYRVLIRNEKVLDTIVPLVTYSKIETKQTKTKRRSPSPERLKIEKLTSVPNNESSDDYLPRVNNTKTPSFHDLELEINNQNESSSEIENQKMPDLVHSNPRNAEKPTEKQLENFYSDYAMNTFSSGPMCEEDDSDVSQCPETSDSENIEEFGDQMRREYFDNVVAPRRKQDKQVALKKSVLDDVVRDLQIYQ
ncbi:serine/arginine repetitive matrix protein 1-like [Physella acuta]|uniref:serine/arginine repetitive matrix protein 1-like n=1 Tax=Physella acuta TaxID=109671 RepID=UPI0027DE0D26|nr:serine/arginine repetitive matrix protein 1-like [Physella acuta]XP_059166138.1 serine/arginine repetitive matrix protein 1-like [Physella acuta]